MRKTITFLATLILVTALVTVLGHGERAWAAGFYLGEQDSVASARSLAVTAKLEEPSTLFFNPAGLTFLDGLQASIAASELTFCHTLSMGALIMMDFL